MQQPTETTVKTYTNANDLQKDQQRMALQGWNVINVTTHQPRSGIGRNVLLGPIGAIAFKPKAQLVATYQRIVQPDQPQQPPRRLTLKEQIEIKKEERRRKFGF